MKNELHGMCVCVCVFLRVCYKWNEKKIDGCERRTDIELEDFI